MPKLKKCKACDIEFMPANSMVKACSWQCALSLAKEKNGKKRKLEFNRETKRRKQALKTKNDWKKEVQTAFNRYIRGRDRGQNCISCGLSIKELKINSVIQMVCGHYLSVGARPELRFEPINANLQCTRCNGGAGKYGKFNNKGTTVTQNYRVNLIDKIGIEKVEWLEGKHGPKKYTIEDLKGLKKGFNERAKARNVKE